MAYDQQSFEKLLSEAPQAPTTETVSLVGTLRSRANQGSSFWLCRTGAQLRWRQQP